MARARSPAGETDLREALTWRLRGGTGTAVQHAELLLLQGHHLLLAVKLTTRGTTNSRKLVPKVHAALPVLQVSFLATRDVSATLKVKGLAEDAASAAGVIPRSARMRPRDGRERAAVPASGLGRDPTRRPCDRPPARETRASQRRWMIALCRFNTVVLREWHREPVRVCEQVSGEEDFSENLVVE